VFLAFFLRFGRIDPVTGHFFFDASNSVYHCTLSIPGANTDAMDRYSVLNDSTGFRLVAFKMRMLVVESARKLVTRITAG